MKERHIQEMIENERRLRVIHSEAVKAEIVARTAHNESMKILETALIMEGGWQPGQEIIRDGSRFRLHHVYLTYDGKRLNARCNRIRKAGGWTLDARDVLLLRELPS
jgi:hypothetical protein